MRLLVGLWLTSLVVAAPLALAVRSSLEESIGPSLVHESLQKGFDMAWHGEYAQAARGIERSVRPSMAGGGALLDNAEAWLTGNLFQQDPTLVGVGVLYALLWTFLLGGVLDRLAHPDGERSAGRFARACGAYFPRFLLLTGLAGALYYGVYRSAGWLLGRVEEWTRDVTTERTVLAITLAAWAAVALALVVVYVWLTLARVSLVKGDRPGALAAVWHGGSVLLRRPQRTLGAYLVYAALGAGLVSLYVVIAPAAGPASIAGLLLAFALGQACLLVKLALRFGVLAALTEEYGRACADWTQAVSTGGPGRSSK